MVGCEGVGVMGWYGSCLCQSAVAHACAQSCPTLCDPWTEAHQAPLCMGFFRQENWSGLPFPIPGYLPVPGIEPFSCRVLYILSNQTDYTMVFYLHSLLLFAFLRLFIASSNRGGPSHTQSIQSAVKSREMARFHTSLGAKHHRHLVQ